MHTEHLLPIFTWFVGSNVQTQFAFSSKSIMIKPHVVDARDQLPKLQRPPFFTDHKFVLLFHLFHASNTQNTYSLKGFYFTIVQIAMKYLKFSTIEQRLLNNKRKLVYLQDFEQVSYANILQQKNRFICFATSFFISFSSFFTNQTASFFSSSPQKATKTRKFQ